LFTVLLEPPLSTIPPYALPLTSFQETSQDLQPELMKIPKPNPFLRVAPEITFDPTVRNVFSGPKTFATQL
jgi:hypothetical protein